MFKNLFSKDFNIEGSNLSVTVNKGRIVVNGKDVTPKHAFTNIIITGNVDKLNVDSCNVITVNGSVKNVETISGDIEVKQGITGNVSTMSGDVECEGNIGGKVATMSGDIEYRK